MFKKFFGRSVKPEAHPSDRDRTPPEKSRRLVLLPETEDELRRCRIKDPLGTELLFISAYLDPRRIGVNDPHRERLIQARIDRRMPAVGQDICVENLGCGEFSTTPSQQDAMQPATIAALKMVPESLVLLVAEDAGGSESEGVLVFHPDHGGIGLLPADESGFFNALLLNLELRTGRYGRCMARVEDDIVRLDLASYGTCYNRCQRVLEELNAGAQYVSE